MAVIVLSVSYLYSDYVLSDENGKTIEAGEYVYIYNTVGLDGFSIDYNKQYFVDGGIVKEEGNRILIGRLRDDLKSGTLDTIILNTIEGMNYLEMKISPVFSDLNLNERESKKDTMIRGVLSFESRGKQTLSGIDSVKLIVSSQNEADMRTFNIFSNDESEDNRTSQNLNFEFSSGSIQDDYSVSVARYTLSLAETTYYAGGFSTRVRDEYPKNLLIIDSRSKVTADNLSEAYYDNRFETVKTFYETPNASLFNLADDGIIVLVNVEGGYILENLNLFSSIKGYSEKYTIFIFSNNLCKYLSQEDSRTSRDYIEMLFGIKCTESSSYEETECEGIKSMDDMEVEKMENSQGEEISFIRRDNLFLFLYLPEKIDIDQLNAIKRNLKFNTAKQNFKSLSSVVDVEYQGYGEYSIEIYGVSGNMLFSTILGEMPSTTKSIDLSEFLKDEDIYDSGVYTYKIKKDQECIRCGKFYFIYH